MASIDLFYLSEIDHMQDIIENELNAREISKLKKTRKNKLSD